MIQKKICLVGASGLGKTSLVARYVRNMFSEKYMSSIGVKVDKKTLAVNGTDVNLMIWDIYGDDEFQALRTSYLRGASGYLMVVDGTRRSTLDKALDLKKQIAEALGDTPMILVLNKADMTEAWDLPEDLEPRLAADGWTVLRGSAKSGMGVEESFSALAAKMIAG